MKCAECQQNRLCVKRSCSPLGVCFKHLNCFDGCICFIMIRLCPKQMHVMYVKAVKMYVIICLYLNALFSSEERKVSVPMSTCTVQETATYSLHLEKMMEKGNWDRRE